MASNQKANKSGLEPPLAITEILGELAQQAPAGYAIALHIRFMTPNFLFQAYPQKWMDYYSKNGFVMHDPTVIWGFENSGHIDWSDLLAQDTAGVMAAAAQHGISQGVTFAFELDGSRTIASFARSDRRYLPAEIEALETTLRALHVMTAASQGLDAATRRELRRMSVEFTHSGGGA